MSSLLQCVDSRAYVFTHTFGPLAATLPSVVQPTAHLSWISVMLQAMDEYVFENEGPLMDI